MDPNSAWHWGFGAAGVGMTLGLIQYVLGWTCTSARRGSNRPSRDLARRACAKLKQQAIVYIGLAWLVIVVLGRELIAAGVVHGHDASA